MQGDAAWKCPGMVKWSDMRGPASRAASATPWGLAAGLLAD
jgi:hypothetical protein